MTSWKKLGRIFCPDKQHKWMQTHASTPFPLFLEKDRFRIFFSTRDAHNQSSITCLEMDTLPEPNVITVSNQPVLSPGKAGFFDDNGVTMSQIVRWNNQDYLYYIGWNLATKMPFRNNIGLAIAPAGSTTFEKYSPAPIIDRNPIDPLSLSYPWVIIENGLWRMWYGSHITIEENDLDVEHVIKYAESRDGITWVREGHVCISLNKGESGVVRPYVMHDGSLYHMWYSIRIGRKETYKLGYATSKDGLQWTRHDDKAGLLASSEADAWDHDMICYPCLFEHKGRQYMLYNGNSFGKTGFGLAVWDG